MFINYYVDAGDVHQPPSTQTIQDGAHRPNNSQRRNAQDQRAVLHFCNVGYVRRYAGKDSARGLSSKLPASLELMQSL